MYITAEKTYWKRNIGPTVLPQGDSMEDLSQYRMDGMALDEIIHTCTVGDDGLAALQEWGDEYASSFLEYQNLRDIGVPDDDAYSIAQAVAEKNDGLFRYETLDEEEQRPKYISLGLTADEFQRAHQTFGAELPTYDELVTLLSGNSSRIEPTSCKIAHPYEICINRYVAEAHDTNETTVDKSLSADRYENTVIPNRVGEDTAGSTYDTSFTGPPIDAVKRYGHRIWNRGVKYAALTGMALAAAFGPSPEEPADQTIGGMERPSSHIETVISGDFGETPESVLEAHLTQGDMAERKQQSDDADASSGGSELADDPISATRPSNQLLSASNDNASIFQQPSIEAEARRQFDQHIATTPMELYNQQINQQTERLWRQHQTEQQFSQTFGGILGVNEWVFGSGNDLIEDVGIWTGIYQPQQQLRGRELTF